MSLHWQWTYSVLCWWLAVAAALGRCGWPTGWRYGRPANTPSPWRRSRRRRSDGGQKRTGRRLGFEAKLKEVVKTQVAHERETGASQSRKLYKQRFHGCSSKECLVWQCGKYFETIRGSGLHFDALFSLWNDTFFERFGVFFFQEAL